MASAASLGNLVVRITANSSDAETALTRIKKAVGATFAIGAVDLFAKGLSSAVSNAFALDKQLTLLNTIASQTFDAKQVRDFSNAIGVDAASAAGALYVAFSSGASTASQALADVSAAQDLAKTTGTDLATSTKTVIGLVNAYGSASFDAADAAAVVYEGFKDGVGTANDYASALGKVIPIANQLGISAQEIAAEVAASTQTLKSAPAAATGLNTVYTELARSSSFAGKTFKDAFGESFQAYLKQGHTGLEGIEKLLSKYGTDKTLDIFHAKGAGTAVNQLLTSFPALQKALKDQTTAQGDFQGAIAETNKSASYQANLLKNEATNALGSFGDALKPAALELLPALTNFLKQATPELERFGQDVSAVAGFLVKHGDAIKTVAELIAIRFIPYLTALGVQLGTKLIFSLANATLAFLGFGTRVGVTATEVIVADDKIAASVTGTAAIIQREMQTGQLAFFGLGESATASAATVGAADAEIAASSKLAAGTVGASSLSIGSRVAGAAGTVGIVLSLASLAWDKFGAKSITGEGLFSSAIDGVKYAAGKAGDGILHGLGDLAGGFGLFNNSVSNSLKNTGTAAGNFADGVISNLRQIDVDVYDSAGNIISNLSAIQQQFLITSGALTKGSALNNALNNGSQLVQRGPGIQVETPSQVASDAARKAAAQFTDALKKTKVPLPTTGADLPGADTAADKIKTAITSLTTDLTNLAHVSQLSKDQIDSLFKTIEKDSTDAGQKGVIPLEKKFNKSLDAMADKLATLKDKVSVELDFGKQTKQAVLDLGSVAQATEGIGTTFTGIVNEQRKALYQSNAFYAAFKKLEALGLNNTSLSQLAQAGPASLASAQALLSGGAAGVSQINANQKQLDAAADKIANKTADNYYAAGKSVSQGFLAGIQSQEKELEKTMDNLGQTAAKSLKKALGIHSPSKVMQGLGEFTSQGLADGIISGSRKVSNASANMAGSVIFGAGSVVVGAGTRSPLETGTLTGKGIVSVLERNKAQRALGGVG